MPKFTQSPVKRLPHRAAISAPVFLPPSGGPLDKLARQVTSFSERDGIDGVEDDLKLSKSAKFSAKESFGKRARVKYLTEAMAVGLANVPNSKLTKSYWNTFYCSSVLQKKGDTLTGKYCKNRWCLVCCRIRSAQLIKQYAPLLESWPEKHLVTLTVPNCSEELLESTVKDMKRGFDTIRRRFTMQHRRKQRESALQALRKLEATHNPERDDYHPHFHLVVPDLATANELREAWLIQFPQAKWKGQDVRPANAGAAHELFKYFTKLVTTQSKERFIRLAPLNVIFEAIAGQQTFKAFGVVKLKEELGDEEATALAEELNIDAVFEWVQAQADWVDKSSGEMLTNYQPSPQFRKFVESKIVYNSPQKKLQKTPEYAS
jgi:transcription termination factor NusB